MSKLIMFPHGGSGNHGCEAIVRTTTAMFDDCSRKLLISSAIRQDTDAGLDKLCTILPELMPVDKCSWAFAKAWMSSRLAHNVTAFDDVAYRNIIKNADSDTIALSIGGDNYCYGVPELYMYFHKKVKEKGAKTVLWGCSVEPDAVKGTMADDLASFDLITARESITYEALKAVNPNTVLCADPAFTLKTERLPLPDRFVEGNTVGVNISPMIISNETNEGMAYSNYVKLVEYVIKETGMHVALIPHVCWSNNDDRIPLQKLYDRFSDTGRVVMIEEHNCMQIKGFIARCRFFVGARTHATIAAYSSCVPTLVTGYSVKARGIAKDLFGTDTNYVMPVQGLQSEDDLQKGFAWLMENEDAMRQHLEKIMPEYVQRAYIAQEAAKKLLSK